jgi:hypothetical protein
MTQDDLRAATVIVSVLALAVAVLAAVFSYASSRFNLRNKQVDVILQDNKRFDDLQALRTSLRVAEAAIKSGAPDAWSKERLAIECEMFFDRFWSLQFDGYIAWYSGYLPGAIYKYWLFARWRELREPSESWNLNGYTLWTSLSDAVAKRWKRNPDNTSSQSMHVNQFIQMMDYLKNHDTVNLNHLLRTYGPSPLRLWWRQRFGAESE